MSLDTYLRGLPKAELHLHIEGTLEPDLAFALAERNGVRLPFEDVQALSAAYDFDDLQSFLDLYYATSAVLREPEDFNDLTAAYLRRAVDDGVRRAEIFFDPQTHSSRGVPLEAVIEGIGAAFDEAAGEISTGLILCVLRDRPVAEAMATLVAALPHRGRLLGVGLDSAEVGNPPSRFVDVFARARAEGLRVVAHAGEEGPPAYITEALDLLGAERIDHGVRAVEDPDVLRRLAVERIPLTVCPLSNLRLRVVDRLEDHPLGALLDAGVAVTVNADDPAYFGGYVGDNYVAIQRALGLPASRMAAVARTSLEAAFLPEEQRARLLDEHDTWVAGHPPPEVGT